MTLQEKIHAYDRLRRQIEELEAQKKQLVAEILPLLTSDSLTVDHFQVRRVSRLSIRTSLESAKLLGAIKIEECVDKDKIKKMYAQGHEVPDVSPIEYIHVSKLKVGVLT